MAKIVKENHQDSANDEIVEDVLQGDITIIGLGVAKSHLAKDEEYQINAEDGKRLIKQGWAKLKK